MHPHLARDMRQDLMAAVQLHSEHGVRKRLGDGSLHLYDIFFRHDSRPVAPITVWSGSEGLTR